MKAAGIIRIWPACVYCVMASSGCFLAARPPLLVEDEATRAFFRCEQISAVEIHFHYQ